MPELKPIHAVLILVLIAIAALYVLGVGLGATGKSPSAIDPMEEARTLKARFLKPRPVKAEELATACSFTDGALAVPRAATCTVDVKASDTRSRSLGLTPRGASSVKVEWVPRGRPSVPATFNTLDEAKTLDVTQEGADLKVTCLVPVAPLPFCMLFLLPASGAKADGGS
ncbi:hypothetical protein JY651_49610 [Pyxidicoccus parkwayensis]|uniref:Ig-like domain-containing protein n=1 Tax=Pyxidicoccus parkwayensis TaxID=2813578 RepID=A0ABX7P004_9BACT|nr:hypothetical protein [Pyxidicoccus parkwaysis]QSQ23062.1 hypothetical protein JY651_49610 [Pyxidicoccus parkwaysis]